MRAPGNTLTDGLVSLAPFELADAPTIMSWDADPDVQRWFDWPLTPPVDDRDSYAARRASAERTVRHKWARWESGEELAFIIRAATSGEGLGWIDLQPRGAGRGNVSYGVLAASRGRGAATRAVVLVTRYAIEVLGWYRLEIRANAENVASRTVALKAGYRLDGVLRGHGLMEKYQPLAGQRFDEAIYSRLSTDA
jgi:RimJ/RimL family protein N-acetyltransferase